MLVYGACGPEKELPKRLGVRVAAAMIARYIDADDNASNMRCDDSGVCCSRGSCGEVAGVGYKGSTSVNKPEATGRAGCLFRFLKIQLHLRIFARSLPSIVEKIAHLALVCKLVVLEEGPVSQV